MCDKLIQWVDQQHGRHVKDICEDVHSLTLVLVSDGVRSGFRAEDIAWYMRETMLGAVEGKLGTDSGSDTAS